MLTPMSGFDAESTEAQPAPSLRATMSAVLSRRLIDAALAEATRATVSVTVVVVDESGVLKELVRMDGAPLVSVQTAINKAYAAAAIGMPPDDFYAAIESDGAAVAEFATRPGLALIACGLPVIAGMRGMANRIPASDGVARFNHLYLEETVAVDTATHTAGFGDPEFISALDVVCAGRYFAAVDAVRAGQQPPRSWAPLFAARGDPRIAPIQFALAGMNAHINHDLPLALVSTFQARSLEISRDSPQYRDYLKVNETI